jgi:site-specific DNA recombinase
MTPTNGQRIAAIYARVSTTEQADKGFSLPTQIEACQALATREGYAVPESHIFVDDYTGTSLNRPQLTGLRELVRNRLVSAVIVHDLDRLSRKLAHQLLLSEECEQASVVLHIVTMPAQGKSPETQLLANVRGIIAEYERAKLLERTERGRRGRAQAGKICGGLPPLGYQYGQGTYRIDEAEAALVQDLFHRFAAGGLSLYGAAAWLTAQGIATPRERRGKGPHRTAGPAVWNSETVRRILRNETYLGTAYYGKQSRLPGARNPDLRTRWQTNVRAGWTPIAVPPIISQEVFDAVQAQLCRNAQAARRNRKYEYLLVSGRLRCGQCGRGMSGSINQRGLRFYKCTRAAFEPCAHRRRVVLAERVEPAVWAAIERALRNPTLIAEEVTRRREDTSGQQTALAQERHEYERQLAQCEKDLKRWEAAYLGEAIDLDDFKAKKTEVETRRASATRELARLDDQQHLLEQVELETAMLTDYCRRVSQQLHRFDVAEQRLALEALNILSPGSQTPRLWCKGVFL